MKFQRILDEAEKETPMGYERFVKKWDTRDAEKAERDAQKSHIIITV